MKDRDYIADPLTAVLFSPPSYEPRLTRGERAGLLLIAAVVFAAAVFALLGS